MPKLEINITDNSDIRPIDGIIHYKDLIACADAISCLDAQLVINYPPYIKDHPSNCRLFRRCEDGVIRCRSKALNVYNDPILFDLGLRLFESYKQQYQSMRIYFLNPKGRADYAESPGRGYIKLVLSEKMPIQEVLKNIEYLNSMHAKVLSEIGENFPLEIQLESVEEVRRIRNLFNDNAY
jgi:hypothetical protein